MLFHDSLPEQETAKKINKLRENWWGANKTNKQTKNPCFSLCSTLSTCLNSWTKAAEDNSLILPVIKMESESESLQYPEFPVA